MKVSRVAGGVLFLGVRGLETSAGVTDEYRDLLLSGGAPLESSGAWMPQKWSRHASICAETPSFLSLATDAPSPRAFSPLYPDTGPFLPRKLDLDQRILQFAERNMRDCTHFAQLGGSASCIHRSAFWSQ